MNKEDFKAAFELVTQKQKPVLKLFLQGKNDKEIAQLLTVSESNIRHHIRNICEIFGLQNEEGERLSWREELIELFGQYQPGSVNPELLPRFKPPEYPNGSVPLDSPYYIERPGVESQCYETILQLGSLIRIKAPKQMGKTSLLDRIITHAQENNFRIIRFNLQELEASKFDNIDTFLRYLCGYIRLQLNLPNQLDEFWDEAIIGSVQSCKYYFGKNVLEASENPLVLAIDEVDRVLDYPKVYPAFFGMLRGWYEEAKNKDIWKRLRLVVVHSTEDYGRLDINQSPFNVGISIELTEFTAEQVQILAKRHKLNGIGEESLIRLRELVGGHPYLIRLAFYHLNRQEVTLEQLLQEGPSDAGIYHDHLRRHLQILKDNTKLAEAFKQVVENPKSVKLDTMQAYKLHSMGLIQRQGDYSSPRCKLYRLYFRERLEY